MRPPALQSSCTAVSNLTLSELESRRLRATKAQLDQRWSKVGGIIAEGIGRGTRDVGVEADYQASAVWTGLVGRIVERIDRNRGRANVAPFCELSNDLMTWLGYQEVWDADGGRTPFVFRQASLSIHAGDVGDPIKPQLLRLEWPGLRDWDRSGVGFQSHNAGHPHWQIDVLESLRNRTKPVQFDPDPAGDLETFEAAPTRMTLSDRIRELALENMHLASAAPWWVKGPGQFGLHHLNAPESQESLCRWLKAAIAYIRQELSRCLPNR
jgi:hypothetical protein